MSNNSTESFWLDAWYQGRWWLWLLWPVSLLLSALASIRRRRQSAKAKALSAPVIVVGNITLGGTGKTPVIIALVRYLQSKGYNPGVLSRGYGAKAPYYPYLVTPTSPVHESGDEPLLIALETGCPVMVGADRIVSAQALIDDHGCDLLLSDDGLQHYRLSRQWEICVLDAKRLWGNGLCLPAGPLREPPKRLADVDAIIVNGLLSSEQKSLPEVQSLLSDTHAMALQPSSWHRLDSEGYGGESSEESCSIANFQQQLTELGKPPFAITGIGNPDRFFNTLSGLGITCPNQSFPDHYAFSASDLEFTNDKLLLMTAKDAVKCRSFAKPDWWYLSVSAQLPDSFWGQLDDFLQR